MMHRTIQSLICCAGLIIAASAEEQMVQSLKEITTKVRIDPESITVSGISSGGFMAHQMHVIHSERIMGAAIIAGGPYRCAKEHFWGSYFDPTGLYAAASVCTRTSNFNPSYSKPNARFSIKEAKKFAKKNEIDDIKNLTNSRIWLFSGDHDHRVPTATMDALYTFYDAFAKEDNINYVHHARAGHAMPTDTYGNRCSSSRPPYINNCGYDAAGELLKWLYGSDLNPRVKARKRGLIEFDQTPYFDTEDASISLAETGLIYLPESCAKGEPCKLHIAFHGCKQNTATIGTIFAEHAGYNEWAEANNIIVLYPQTSNWHYKDPADIKRNPKGCWDWWGYSGEDFSSKDGKQITAVKDLVALLTTQ